MFRIEFLESREVPATRLVVPIEQAVDNTTTFHGVDVAMSGVVSGDTIQIEPGAQPGTLNLSQLANVTNLTIQGNPAAGAQDAGSLLFSGNFTIDPSRLGLTFRNLHLLNTSTLTINTKVTMDRVIFEHVGNSAQGIQINGTANVLFTASTFLDNDQTSSIGGSLSLVGINPSTGSNNQFIGNTFRQNVVREIISYNHTGLTTVTDLFTDNVIIGPTGGGGAVASMVIHDPLSGIVIRNNTFTDPDSLFGAGLFVNGNGATVTIERNLFDFHPISGARLALDISGGTLSTGNIAILNNRFDTDGVAIGLSISPNAAGAIPIKIEGNDFNNNKLGVRLLGGGSSMNNIDLGGGSLGSLGGNNFRTFTTAANGTAGAIVTSVGNASIVQAKGNLFNVGLATPETVINDANDTAAFADVVVTGNLTGNAGAVQAIFTRFLQRTGNTTNPADAGQFVTSLNNGVPLATVVNVIARSAEAFGLVVDQLYITILGRQSDAPGKSFWIGQLQSGVTLESVESQFFASREFEAKAVSNTGFVAALYARLLGRAASSADLNFWVGQIASLGRQNVSLQILKSAEHRFRTVNSFYLDLLHRTVAPSVAEVNGWVNSGLDLYTIKVTFASTAEFGSNG